MREAGSATAPATSTSETSPAWHAPDITTSSIVDIAGAIRRAAEQVRQSQPGETRAIATRTFWRYARMLRASQPPLLLPHRSEPATRRIGYLVDPQRPGVLESIHGAHATGDERVVVFVIGRGRTAPAGVAAINLSGMSDAQIVRIVVGADLDALVDMTGLALVEMPLVVAMHPARAIVEPLFEPQLSPDDIAPTQRMRPTKPSQPSTAGGQLDFAMLIDMARGAAAHDWPSLPDGITAIDLAQQLDPAVRTHRAGVHETAKSGYLAVLARYPEHPVALYLLGQLSSARGETHEALAMFDRAAQSAPDFRDAHYAIAQRHAENSDWLDALHAYRKTVELTPQFAAAWSGVGLSTLRTDGDTSVAIEYLQRAVAIEPSSAQWEFNLGTACQHAGRLAEARAAYARVLAGDPHHRDARFNLGAVLQEIGEYRLAIDAYSTIVADQPDFAPAYPELGACLQLTGQVDAWLQNFQNYRERCALTLPMAVYGLEASMAAGNVEDHQRWREGILSGSFPAQDNAEFVDAWEQLLFLLLHVDVDRGTLRDCYERYDAAAGELYGSTGATPQRTPGPIRIGYVSGDLRDHVMGRMIHEWVTRHDRARFAVTLYSLSRHADHWTERFRALDATWVDLSATSLRDASERIAADDIDILVDCSGHTRGGRPGLFARKPARIQATHIATPGPLGLHAIDYKLTDALSEATDAQRYLIERLMPVPGGVFPWHRYGVEPPAADARRNDVFLCGTFVSLMKLSPRCLALWRRVLDSIPHAALAFSPPSDEWQPSYLRWLHANGIPGDRVRFIPYDRSETGRLARYAVVDVVLDPLPCGNVNGTMEALAMGVPVITLVGVRHGERLGNALLSRFGVTDTIAQTEGEYVAIATALANDREGADRLRARIRQLAIDSPVWNSESQVRRVEAVYERMVAGHRTDAGPR